MEEVMEKCTEAYGGCDTRLVVLILLKRPPQWRKKMPLLPWALCWDLARRRAWEEGNNCVWEESTSSQPSQFPFTLYQEGCCTPWRGAKEAKRRLCRRHLFSSGADVAPRRKSRKLFIPNHQLLLFSFQMSFFSQLRDISFPLAEEVWGTLPPLNTPQPCTLAPHANRGVTSPGVGGKVGS